MLRSFLRVLFNQPRSPHAGLHPHQCKSLWRGIRTILHLPGNAHSSKSSRMGRSHGPGWNDCRGYRQEHRNTRLSIALWAQPPLSCEWMGSPSKILNGRLDMFGSESSWLFLFCRRWLSSHGCSPGKMHGGSFRGFQISFRWRELARDTPHSRDHPLPSFFRFYRAFFRDLGL